MDIILKREDVFHAGEMGTHCVERSLHIAEEYRGVAERLHCSFLDAGSIPGMEMYPYDYMHLSLESHKIFANIIIKSVTVSTEQLPGIK